ncbi:MAG: glycosyltransferase family 4 protein, partial [Gemmatimonadales bacterium]
MSFTKIGRGLLERGHDVHVVTSGGRQVDRFLKERLPVTPLRGRRDSPTEVWGLWRTLRRTGAQAILTDSPRDVRLSAYATLLHRARIVYRYNLNYRSSRYDIMDRVYLRRVAACFYQSRYIRNEAHSHAPRLRGLPSMRIPNGYDTAFLVPDPDAGRAFRERHGIEPHATVVLSSAKLTHGKGHEVAVEALYRVRRDGVNLVYVICGDGSKEGELRAMAERLSLRTVFTGLLAPTEMVAALSATDVVVHPSLHEIFPNAVGEAMSCGLPVVATDAGGTSELLGRGGTTGILVAPGEVEPLADAVHLLADNRELRTQLGAAARCRIEERFPLKRMIDG